MLITIVERIATRLSSVRPPTCKNACQAWSIGHFERFCVENANPQPWMERLRAARLPIRPQRSRRRTTVTFRQACVTPASQSC